MLGRKRGEGFRWAVRSIVFAGTGIAAVMGSAGGVAAQTSEREVLLGVSRVGRGQTADHIEREAAMAFGAAVASLNGGAAKAAQRQFEQLVANYPDTASAERARRELARLYGSDRTETARSQASLPASGGSYLGARDLPAAIAGPVGVGGWRTEVHPVHKSLQRTVQDEFRAMAGDMVFFSEGSAELGARARKVLAAQADWLKKHVDRSVLIEGHADDRNSGVDAKAVSMARADAVRRRLIDEGIADARISVIAHGADKRIALCSDDSCASQNRRAATSIAGNTAVGAIAR